MKLFYCSPELYKVFHPITSGTFELTDFKLITNAAYTIPENTSLAAYDIPNIIQGCKKHVNYIQMTKETAKAITIYDYWMATYREAVPYLIIPSTMQFIYYMVSYK